MRPSLRSAPWVLFAASLVGGHAVALAQTGKPSPGASAASAGSGSPASGAAQTPPAPAGKKPPGGGGQGPMADDVPAPVKRMRQGCAADIQKFCKAVPEGRGRIAVCLNGHLGELSASCKPLAQEVAARMSERRQMHVDCAADIQRLCGAMPAGRGLNGLCLGEHAAQLSPVCKKHVDELKLSSRSR